MMYLHPWELDPDQPKMQGSSLSKFRHYINLHKTEDRLSSLLGDFCFTSIRGALEPVGQACAKAEVVYSQAKLLALDDHIESVRLRV